MCIAFAQHAHICFTRSPRRRWKRRPRSRRRVSRGRRRRWRRSRCARLQRADPHPPATLHRPPAARPGLTAFPWALVSLHSSLSAASRYPSQAEARSWAAAEAAEAAAAQLRAARREAAEEKDCALKAVSEMRAQMVAQQAAAEAALLDAVS